MRSACDDDISNVITKFTKASMHVHVSVDLYWDLQAASPPIILLLGAIAPLAPTSHHLEPPMSENNLRLAGTSFETKDNYDFNVVNANEAMLIILQLTSTFCAQVGGPKAAPFEPLDFLQVGGPFREVGGRGLPWLYGNSNTARALRVG